MGRGSDQSISVVACSMSSQAAAWLLSFDSDDSALDKEHHNEHPVDESRNEACYQWLETSPDHLRVFLETVETLRRLQMVDARRLIEVETLLRNRADVIPLWRTKPAPRAHRADTLARESLHGGWPRSTSRTTAKRVPLRASMAAIVILALISHGKRAMCGWCAVRRCSSWSTTRPGPSQTSTFGVEPEGNDWVIRSR